MTELHLQEPLKARKNSECAAVLASKHLYAIAVLIVITVLLALGFKTAYGRRLDEQMRTIPSAVQATTQNSKLGMDLIRELRNGHVKQVKAGVRFKSVKNQGSTIVIEGTSLSTAALFDMISSLQSTGYFSDIEINETYPQDSNNKTQAFKFQLTCEVETDKS